MVTVYSRIYICKSYQYESHMAYHNLQRCIVVFFVLLPSFSVQATTYEQDEDAESSTPLAEDLSACLQALEEQRKIHNNKRPHADVAKALENVGHAYIKQRDYRQGLVYYKKALKMTKALYGKAPHIEIANMLKNVGFAYGKYRTPQLTYYKKALSMYKVLYKDQSHVDVANMLSNIGQIYNDRGNIREALSYAKESLAMFKTLYGNSPHLKVANALFNVGISYQALLDPDNALLHLQQSLKVYAELADSELYENMADVLNQIGLIYFGQKDFEQGLVYFRQIVEVYKSQGGGHVYFGQAQAMQNMGISYIELKDFSKAILHLEEALNIYKTLFKNRVKPVVLNCLDSIGYAYEQISNFPESMSRYKQALEMSQELYDVDGASYKSGYFTEKIARVYGHMHHLSLQISYLQTAKDMYQRLGEQGAKRMSDGITTYSFITDENIARTQYDIGWAYCLLGDLQQSLTHFSYASNDYKILYKENKVTEALLEGAILSLRMVGMTYGSLGKYKQAEKYYRKSLKVAHDLDKPYYYAYAHYYLGCFYHLAMRGVCQEKTKQRYIKSAQVAFESAVEAINEPGADLLTGYADFLIDTEQFSPAYNYLTRTIASGDNASSLQYVWGNQTAAPHILQEKLQQEKVVTVRAIDYAFYLLLHHYEAFQQAGITLEQTQEAYLAAYAQGIKARAGQPGKAQQDALASYLLDSLQNAGSMH